LRHDHHHAGITYESRRDIDVVDNPRDHRCQSALIPEQFCRPRQHPIRGESDWTVRVFSEGGPW
jgi:hypothetical protein